MIDLMLQLLSTLTQNAGKLGMPALGELFFALFLGVLGYQGYVNIKTPTDRWDKFLKNGSIVLMAFGALDALIVGFSLIP